MSLQPEGEDPEAHESNDSGEPSDLLARLEDLEDEASERETRYLQMASTPDYLRRLQTAAASLLEEPQDFTPGDLVTWKAGLRNRYFPAANAPAVVLKIALGTVSEETDASSSLYQEPLDLQLGVIDGDGDFLSFYYDRRRFVRWVQEQ